MPGPSHCLVPIIQDSLAAPGCLPDSLAGGHSHHFLPHILTKPSWPDRATASRRASEGWQTAFCMELRAKSAQPTRRRYQLSCGVDPEEPDKCSLPRNGRAQQKDPASYTHSEAGSVTGAHGKLLASCQLALHQAEDYLIPSEGTKLFSVRLSPDLPILKHRFEPGSERRNSCWVGIVQMGSGNSGCSSTTISP